VKSITVPITPLSPSVASDAPAGSLALMHQIVASLEGLIASKTTATIDIHRLPLTPQENQALERTLGEGEVDASVEALGRTRIRETGYPGVWWVTHYNRSSQIIGESIEITDLPELIKSQPEDIRSGLARLRRELEQPPEP
jgi:hydrogenase-1 operon protein HyaF